MQHPKFIKKSGVRAGAFSGYGAGHPKRTPVGDSKCNALYNQGQGCLPRNINFKVLSSSYDDG